MLYIDIYIHIYKDAYVHIYTSNTYTSDTTHSRCINTTCICTFIHDQNLLTFPFCPISHLFLFV